MKKLVGYTVLFLLITCVLICVGWVEWNFIQCMRKELYTLIDTLMKYPEIWNISRFGCVHWAEDTSEEIARRHNVNSTAEVENIFNALWLTGYLKGKLADSPLDREYAYLTNILIATIVGILASYAVGYYTGKQN